MVSIEIDPDLLDATFRAMKDLKAYYEADAAALARLDSKEACKLARKRLKQAKVARRLKNFYGEWSILV